MARGLSQTGVAKLRHSGTPNENGKLATEKHFDRDGLVLRVQPSGAKAWIWRGTVRARQSPDGMRGRGKRVEIGLGAPSYVSLAEARATALKYLRLGKAGTDPRRARAYVTPTFAEVADAAIRNQRAKWRGLASEKQWRASLETYVFPRLGAAPVDTITAQDVADCLEHAGLWKNKAVTARRVLHRMRVAFSWAKGKGFCSGDNPAKGAKGILPAQAKAKGRSFAAMPHQDVAGAILAIRYAKGKGSWIGAKLAIEFQVLTVARGCEVRSLSWQDIDVGAGVWNLPAHKCKTGGAHSFPLSVRAQEILRQAGKAWGRTGCVFPAAKGGRMNVNVLGDVLKAAGISPKVATPHGFRRSFRNHGGENEITRDIMERAMNHAVKGSEAPYYTTKLLDLRRPVMQKWADYVSPTD